MWGHLYHKQLFGIPRARVRGGLRTGNPKAWGVLTIGILKVRGFQVWDFQRGQTRVQKHEQTDETIDDFRKQDT